MWHDEAKRSAPSWLEGAFMLPESVLQSIASKGRAFRSLRLCYRLIGNASRISRLTPHKRDFRRRRTACGASSQPEQASCDHSCGGSRRGQSGTLPSWPRCGASALGKRERAMTCRMPGRATRYRPRGGGGRGSCDSNATLSRSSVAMRRLQDHLIGRRHWRKAQAAWL